MALALYSQLKKSQWVTEFCSDSYRNGNFGMMFLALHSVQGVYVAVQFV